jgi:hypothetical protein
MTHPLTHNLICLKVAHLTNRPHHLPKLPIPPGGANELGPRSFCVFVLPIPTDRGTAYARSSRLSAGQQTQPQCTFSYATVAGCQEYIRREPFHARGYRIFEKVY